MLSKRLPVILSLPLSLGVILRGNARHYDQQVQRFVYDPRQQPWIRGYATLIIVFALLRLILNIMIGHDGDMNQFHISMAFFCGIVLIFVLYGIPTLFEQDINEQLNSTISYFRYLQRTYMAGYDADTVRINKLIDVLLAYYQLNNFSLYLLMCALLILFPRGPISVGPLIPEKRFYFPINILSSLFHCYLLGVAFANMIACGSQFLVYLIYFVLFYTRELRLGRPNYLTGAHLRKSENVMHVFRGFQILHQFTMSTFGVFLLICNGTFMVTAMYLNFVLIRYWEDLHVVTQIALCLGCVLTNGFWAIVLEFGRVLHARGSKVTGSWKSGGAWNSGFERKLMRKFSRSCKPLVLSYGKKFTVGRISVLIFFRGVTRGTVRALLTTKGR